MKKLIISVGALLLMSSSTNKTYPSDQLCMSMLNINELNEWIWQDYQNGRITEEQAEMYSELLQETYTFIEDYYQHLPNGTYYEFDLQTKHNY